jgi:hypothetical protein
LGCLARLDPEHAAASPGEQAAGDPGSASDVEPQALFGYQ